MRKNRNFRTLALGVLLLIGILSLLTAAGLRFSWESRDKDVLAVMSPEDIALLASQSGTSEADWQALLGDWDSFAFEAESGLPVAVVESHDRTTAHLPEGVTLSGLGPYGGVKTLYLYDDYANRVVGDDPKEVENLLFRAVTDRGMRLLILTPFFTTEGEPVTEIAVYQACLEGLEARLERRGYTFGQGFSCLRNEEGSALLLFGGGLLPLVMGVWLVCRVPQLRRLEGLLLLAGAAVLAVLVLLRPDLTRRLLMLAAAVVFPCMGGWQLAAHLRKKAAAPMWQELLCGTAAVVCWSLLSGLSVAALMADGPYMMGLQIFSGVKVALLLPMAFGGCLLLWELRKPLLRTGWKGWLGLGAAGVVLGLAAVLLAVRSGDVSGGISGLETAFRNWLEYTLYVRPRTKELLIAVPCIPLFFWACRRKFAPLQLLCGAGVLLECVSVVNTFCHAVAPLQVSVLRTLLGVGLGLIPGLLAVLVLEGVFRAGRKKKR